MEEKERFLGFVYKEKAIFILDTTQVIRLEIVPIVFRSTMAFIFSNVIKKFIIGKHFFPLFIFHFSSSVSLTQRSRDGVGIDR